MVLIVRKNTQILNLVDVHKFGFCDNLDSGDWPDSYGDVGQFLCLGVGCSDVYWSGIHANILEFNNSFSVAIGVVSWKTSDGDDLRGTGGPVKTTAFCCDEFDGFAARFFVGFGEEDVEGVDLFIGEGNREETDPKEDYG